MGAEGMHFPCIQIRTLLYVYVKHPNSLMQFFSSEGFEYPKKHVILSGIPLQKMMVSQIVKASQRGVREREDYSACANVILE